MKKCLAGVMAMLLILSAVKAANAANHHHEKKESPFRLGVEVLLEDRNELIKGKRFGLITNPTGVDQQLHSIVDRLYHHPDVQLTALFGPEHGVRGTAPAGTHVKSYTDEKTGVPVYSLYGATKKPTPEMLANVDVLLFDIQDVGARFYTYIYTMALAMEAAKENHIPIIVLDRPNPINGTDVEGPIMEQKYTYFVGEYPIPVRHGMTVGELARMFNKEFEIGADLTVVKMEGWKRSMIYDDTPLPFLKPSPNIPTLDAAICYPGTGLIEGTNVSEGRGTPRPFEWIGAPFINKDNLAAKLNSYHLAGVTFQAASFIPATSKHMNQLSHGVQIHITNRESFKPFETGLYLVKTIHDMYPENFRFLAPSSAGTSFFDQLVGSGSIRAGIEAGKSIEEMKKEWQPALDKFMKVRERYLLYK
ncbi:exo-beta-N-acetylmuramidase NamZ family protein [Neobacillus sp. Marseille-QA0830]